MGSDIGAEAVHPQTPEPTGALCEVIALIMGDRGGPATAPGHFQGLHGRNLGRPASVPEE